MSQHNSPSSSASVGPSSSPFAGTDPTLYSPDLARSSKHRHDNVSNVTIVAGSAKKVVEKLKVLPGPSAHALGAFLNELAEDDHNNFISRSLFVSQLPDGTPAGVEQDHELFIVQHQMKLVSFLLFLSSAMLTTPSMPASAIVFRLTPTASTFALTIFARRPKPRTSSSSTVSPFTISPDISTLSPSRKTPPRSKNSKVRSRSPL